MDACIVTSGTGNAFPKDTGNSQLKHGAITFRTKDEAARSVGVTAPHCYTCPRLSALLSPGEGGRTVTKHRHGIDISCNRPLQCSEAPQSHEHCLHPN